MEIVAIPCPQCGHQLQLRDRSLLGQAARCPGCKHKFLLEERAEPVRDDDSLSGRETIAPGELAESLAEPFPRRKPISKKFGRYKLQRELGQGAIPLLEEFLCRRCIRIHPEPTKVSLRPHARAVRNC